MTVGMGTEVFSLHYWVCPCWSKFILGSWLWLSELFAVISNQLSVHFHLLVPFTQIYDFLESLGCCPFQVSRS